MRLLKIALPIVAVLVAIVFAYNQFKLPSVPTSDSNAALQPEAAVDSAQADNANAQTDAAKATVAIAEGANSTVAETDSSVSDSSVSSGANSLVASNSQALSVPSPDYPELYGYEVGVADLPEDDFLALIKRLRNDPALLSDVLSELRAETDPERLKRLTALLGETNNADVLQVAEELVYSSNPDVRNAGLDLLSRIARTNADAYGIANSILASEADPDVLVATMDVLALPDNAGAEARSTALSQVMLLANHESAAVRRHSVSIMVRLTNDASLSPVLYSALSDADASVREAAVYAYTSYPYQTTEAVQRLVDIVGDPNETKGVRNGAILALNNMSPDETIKAQISAAKKQMRDALRAQ